MDHAIGFPDSLDENNDVRGSREKVIIEVDGVVRYFYTYVDQKEAKAILVVSDKTQKRKMSTVYNPWADWELGLVFFPSSQRKMSVQKQSELVDYLVRTAVPCHTREVRWMPQGEHEEIVVPLNWNSFKLYTIHAYFSKYTVVMGHVLLACSYLCTNLLRLVFLYFDCRC
mgnify:CR=1 FL=1